MSSITLLRARVAELEEENVYLQQQIEQLKQQQRATKPLHDSTTASQPASTTTSSSSSATPLSPSSSPIPAFSDSLLSPDSQYHQQSLLLSQLHDQLHSLQQENAVLRSQQGSKSLLMSFALMDGIKEEKEQLRAEADRLRMQLFVMEERRKRRGDSKGQANDKAEGDSNEHTAVERRPSEEAKEEESTTAEAISTEEEQKEDDGSTTATDGKAATKTERTGAETPASDDSESEKVTSADNEERDEEKLEENAASKDKDKDGADKRRVTKKLIKDKQRGKTSPSIQSTTPPTTSPTQSLLSPNSSSTTSPSTLSLPSSTLRISSNRLPFMEDSPLYRQQLDNMRVRVSQMFSRLDHLAEKASEYSRSAMAFSRAGEAFADELDRSWADVEVEDGGEEKKLMEEERKRERNKKKRQNEKSNKNGAPGTRRKGGPAKRRTRESSDGISSASIAEGAQLDSAFLNIGLNNRGQSTTPTPGSAGNGSAGGDAAAVGSSSAPSVTSPLSAALVSNNTLGVATTSAAKLKASASNSSLSIKSFLSDIQAKVSDVLSDKDNHSPSTSPLFINTAAAITSPSANNAPDSAPHIPPTKPLSHSTRAATVSPTSSSTSPSPFSDTHHHAQPDSDLHHADRVQLDIEARQRAERQKHPIPEQPVSLANAMSKMSSIVSTSAEITRNLSAFIDHVMVTAVRSVGDKYGVAVSKTQLSMATLLSDYELALQTRLAKKKHDKQRNVLNMFGQRRTYDEEYQRLCQLRREMELRRFDHIQLLNEVCTAKRSELIEVMCASFLSFVTFFHEGWFAANYVKDEVDVLQEELTKRRLYYQKQAKLTLAQRQRLLKSALPINLPVIFPLSNWHALSENNKTTTMSGYLRQPLDDANPNKDKVKEWKRRWFVLEGGTFYYLNESEYFQPKHVVNVLTCAARPWSKSSLDFCFELISPTRTYVYQAESEYEMKAWVAVFANSTEQLLGQQQTRSDTNALDSKLNVSVLEQQKRVKAGLLSQLRRDNCYCAECSVKDPDWASINLGIMICIVCSGIHRSLGVHVSKVRSMTLDDWDTELLDMMVGIGNDKSNSVFEGALNDDDIGHGSRSGRGGDAAHSKPNANSSREEKEEFIQMKYVRRAFLSKQMLHLCGDVQQMGQRMWQACESDDDIGQLILLHALGCPVGWVNEKEEGRSLLHHAAEYDSVQCVEWLIQNNADVEATDKHGMTPLALAKANQSKLVTRRLEGGTATPATAAGSGSSSAASSGSSTPVARSTSVSAASTKDDKAGKSFTSKPRA